MVHDLTPKPYTVYLTYDVDFVPATSPRASGMKAVHPIWLDVQNGKVYPVFDALKGSGTDGKFTYPEDDPTRAGRKNQYTLPTDGVLVKTFGHLHPGGLYDTFSCRARRPDPDGVHVEGALLRAGGRGVVGRVDDRDARRLARWR